MKTFENVQENIVNSNASLIRRATQMLEKGGLEEWKVDSLNKTIQECQSNIENIEEITTIEIGAETNSLINAIQTAYQFHLEEYWQNFEKFANDYVIGLTPEGEFKNGTYFGQRQCFELGVGINELLCFKGHNPMNDEICDQFRQIVNVNFGTKIPTKSAEQQALRDYDAVVFTDDETAKAQALVHFKEVQRDSGALKYGSTYYTLANDEEYQEAKTISTGMSL